MGNTYTANLDGKPVPLTGTGIVPNVTVSLKQTAPHTIEITYRRAGQPYMVRKATVSPDGKSMSERFTTGPNASGDASVRVLEKQ